MDLRPIHDSVDPAKTCHTIYALEGGKLRMCLPSEFTASDPDARPGVFTTAAEIPLQGNCCS